MPYWDNTCDDCGKTAELVSPMCALCWSCYDGDPEIYDGETEQ